MLLSEIFEYLQYGEFAQLAIGGNGPDEVGIKPKDYPRIVSAVNLALIELHKRFPIKQDQLTLQLHSHITEYILHSDYADSNIESDKPYKYILDAVLIEPFLDNILLIRHVYDELGEEYVLNDINDIFSFHTPQSNVLQVPYPDNENTLSVIFRAGPNKINHVGLSDLTTVNVDLPDQFLEALLNYVAHRIFLSLNLGEGQSEANNFLAKFEAACAQINHLGLFVVDTNQNTKFGENGWV